MLLSRIISSLGSSVLSVRNFREMEIEGVCEHSERISKGDIFVAIRGKERDGVSFIKSAVKRGAECVVCEEEISGNAEETVIKCKNARKTLAEISKIIYGDPLGHIKLIGITGTKGKSTTAEFLYSLLSYNGISCAAVTTLGVKGLRSYNGKSDNTTPSSPQIYKMLRHAWEEGKKYFIIEVSSQSLVDYRLFGLSFDCVIYTGFSYDHIGPLEHESEREYFMAKRRLFTDYGAKLAVVIDDGELSKRMSFGVEKIVRVGEREYDEYPISSVYSTDSGVVFSLSGERVRLGMLGEYNAKNAALAIAAACEISGLEIGRFSDALLDVRVKGRFELYSLGGVGVVIDFAHNADSMRNILIAVRKICVGRLIAVFGSVGGRAQRRRRELALCAEEYADFSIITSDNPALESPDLICEEIRSYYIDPRKARIIPDRTEAIKHALMLAEEGDYVLLLGKGHEEFQQIGKKYAKFSERAIIESLGGKRRM